MTTNQKDAEALHNECPICKGFMPYSGQFCRECAEYKRKSDELKKLERRARKFGGLYGE